MRDPELHDPARAQFALDRLAAALGCSTEAFTDLGPPETVQTLELLRLWLGIDDGQDRTKVLALLRTMRAKAQRIHGAVAPVGGEPVVLAHALQKPDRAP